MPTPNPVRLFHITAIANLQAICATDALLAKNAGAANGIAYENIAHAGAQSARATKLVPNPPGGTIHDYVPFYFAPRSPMLQAIEGGKVANCDWRQADIVHLETTVEGAISGGESYVIYDRNATKPYSLPYTDIADLDKVSWDLFFEDPRLDGFCKYWFDRPTTAKYADRMEKRQAEFLIRERVPLNRFLRIGAIDEVRAQQVRDALTAAGVTLPVEVKPNWYFLGQ